MKAKIMFTKFDCDPTNTESYTCPTEGEIYFELDDTYWRNEFAKAALPYFLGTITKNLGINIPENRNKIYKDIIEMTATQCFWMAEAMIEEMRKRK